MKFDGRNFRKSTKLAVIPNPDPAKPNFVHFGRIIREDQTYPTGCVKVPNMTWKSGTGKNPVMAMPIKITGHSLTNMAFGADGRVYLAFGGDVYISAKR